MNLKHVDVKNFRSLRDISVPLSKNNIIIGENNSGKSSFIDVIRIVLSTFTGTVPFEEYDYFLESEEENPQSSTGIEVELLFEEDEPDEWPIELIRSLDDALVERVWEEDMTQAIKLLRLKFISRYDAERNHYFYKVEFLNPHGEVIPLDESQVFKYLSVIFREAPVFYLSALRNIEEFLKSDSTLWGKLFKNLRIPQEKLNSVLGRLKNINQEILESDPKLAGIISKLDLIQKTLKLTEDQTVTIQTLPMHLWELFEQAQILIKGVETNVSFPLERHGQGTQSLAILFLVEAYLETFLTLVYSKTSTPILLMEELEAHLHPQAIRTSSRQAMNLDFQKIITTHSPYFFQNANITDVRVFRKQGAETKVYYIKDSSSIKLADHEALHIFSSPGFKKKCRFYEESNYLVATEPLGEKEIRTLIGMYKGTDLEQEVSDFCKATQLLLSEDEKRSLHTFMQRTRGELFFSKGWLLVEGQSDYIILSYFAEVLGCPFDQMGMSLIDFQNNGSVELFIKVAKALSFPWMVITDADDQKSKTVASLRKCGYTDKQLEYLVFDTSPYADLETLLASEGFAGIYEEVLDRKRLREVSATRGTREYELQIADLVKKDKIINAYKLVDRLREMGMNQGKIPQKYRELIERCVKISK